MHFGSWILDFTSSYSPGSKIANPAENNFMYDEKDKLHNPGDRQQRPQEDTEKTASGDPQERMEGPLSSLMHNAGDAFKTEETKEEADRKKDQKI